MVIKAGQIDKGFFPFNLGERARSVSKVLLGASAATLALGLNSCASENNSYGDDIPSEGITQTTDGESGQDGYESDEFSESDDSSQNQEYGYEATKITPEEYASEDFKEKFLDEGKLLGYLQYPDRIPPIKDFLDERGSRVKDYCINNGGECEIKNGPQKGTIDILVTLDTQKNKLSGDDAVLQLKLIADSHSGSIDDSFSAKSIEIGVEEANVYRRWFLVQSANTGKNKVPYWVTQDWTEVTKLERDFDSRERLLYNLSPPETGRWIDRVDESAMDDLARFMDEYI